MRVAVLVSGGGTNLQALLDAKNAGGLRDAEFVCVVSNRRKAYALERAKQNGIEAVYLPTVRFENREDYHIALRDILLERKVDLIVLAGFLVVLGDPVIQAFQGRIINIHPSLIPSFCGDGAYGLKVHEMALERGVKVTGATVHFVDGGTDTGPIIFQKAVEILPDDTPEVLQKRVMEEAEWILLPKAVDMFTQGRIHVKDGKAVIE
ncbi:MAG: phosphoribosylglycinamide formyltransferase [Firmicutes bacterium]|nr:phosphoribosylglycinamide formyltransferase [Bacillota bacterium]